jgi:tetratricopeptide (TPR) repeat protein
LPLYQDPPDVVGEASCRAVLGALHSDLKDYSGALEHYEEARKLYSGAKDKSNEAQCLYQSGVIHEYLEQHEQAWSCFEQAQDLYKGYGDNLGQAKCLRGLADVHLGRHQHFEARQKYEEVLKRYEGTDPCDDLATTYWGIAEACMEGGQKNDAIGWMEKLAQLRDSLGEADLALEARHQAEEWRQDTKDDPSGITPEA